MRLTTNEIQRYSRQIILKELGAQGQFDLVDAKVLVIGTGGLGCPVTQYLAGAGIGFLDLMDHDTVHRSNLHRQPLFGESDIDRPKVELAAARANEINPDIHIGVLNQKATPESLDIILGGYDVVVDCTDNIKAKYLINDMCIKFGVSLCHAGVLGFDAQMMTIIPGQSPCLRCVFGDIADDENLPGCSESGVLGAMVGMIGSLMAVEAIKLIIGKGRTLSGRLLHINALDLSFRETKVKFNNFCNCQNKA